MDEKRLTNLTALMWLIFGITMSVFLITAAASKLSAFAIVAVVLIMALSTLGGTIAIWKTSEDKEHVGKAKHDDHYYRVERLVHMLDDEDIAEIENQLQERGYRA